MKRRKEQKSYIKLLIVLLVIVVGYALVSTTLKINGNLLIRNNTWNIHWVSNSVNVTSGSATATTPANVVDASNVEFAVNLNKPGEYYEFTVDAKNDGTVAGLLEIAEIKAYEQDGETEIDAEDVPGYITKEISRANGESLDNFILKSGLKEKFKVRIEYTMDIDEDELDNDFTCIFKFSVKFKQTRVSENYGATLVLNTDENVKGLIGTAYLDPTDYEVECNASSNIVDKALYPATSWPDLDWEGDASDNSRSTLIYSNHEKYASSNDGCMKFYVYKDTGDSYKMILDHNTTLSMKPFPITAYVTNYANKTGGFCWDWDNTDCLNNYWYRFAADYCDSKASNFSEYIDCLYIGDDIIERDTDGWISSAEYITAEEIADITNQTETYNQWYSDFTDWYNSFAAGDADTNDLSDINLNIDANDYAWLLDNVYIENNHNMCIDPNDSCITNGYWAKYIIGGDYLRDKEYYYIGARILYVGANDPFYSKSSYNVLRSEYAIDYLDSYAVAGVRPVITVPKKVFGQS